MESELAEERGQLSESAMEYYRSVCAALIACIEDGGLIELETSVLEERTSVRFVLERDTASRHFGSLREGHPD